jgi:hypothetical protein
MMPKDLLDKLISAVIQEEGNERSLEWSINNDGSTRFIHGMIRTAIEESMIGLSYLPLVCFCLLNRETYYIHLSSEVISYRDI